VGDEMNDERQTIVHICNKLYEKGHLVATSGNVSIRKGDRILITPTATRKDSITLQSIVECDLDGVPCNGSKKPSSEIDMHRAAYAIRSDIGAVIHAHPRYSVACSVLGLTLTRAILPELIVYVGPTPTVPYAMPGSKEQAEAVKPYLSDHNAFLLERHGVLVLGQDPDEALSRLEQLEYIAQISYLTKMDGKTAPLPQEEIVKLVEKCRHSGLNLPKSTYESLSPSNISR